MSLIKWHNQWPGGIPSRIRRHEEPVEDVESATCAWRRFVREQWVDGTDADQQRRALIERWATADQEFRDVSLELGLALAYESNSFLSNTGIEL